MRITNKLGLSQVWVDAVIAADDYDKIGWRSCTGLIAPVRQQLLMERYDEQIEEDVIDRIWLLLGSACHQILQYAAKEHEAALTEERFLIECLGKEISFKADRVEEIPGTDPLQYHGKDFKISTVWSVIYDTKPEWIEQANLYAYALRIIGINVTKFDIELLCRDWSKSEAKKDHSYPQTQIQVIHIEMWDDARCQKLLESRITAYIEAEELEDIDLPACTSQERWSKPDTFAVMKKGAKRSTKNCGTKLEAQQYMGMKGLGSDTHAIEFRPGISTRCEDYCSVKRFCSQHNPDLNPPF